MSGVWLEIKPGLITYSIPITHGPYITQHPSHTIAVAYPDMRNPHWTGVGAVLKLGKKPGWS